MFVISCFGLLLWGFWIGFNTSLPLYWYIDLHSFHSYWSEICVESNLGEKVERAPIHPPLVAFLVLQLVSEPVSSSHRS